MLIVFEAPTVDSWNSKSTSPEMRRTRLSEANPGFLSKGSGTPVEIVISAPY